MSEYRTYIRFKPQDHTVEIYISSSVSCEQRDVLSYKDSQVISTRVDLNIESPGPFLSLPWEVFESLKEGVLDMVERQGGAPTQQSLRGELKRLEDEVKWLRDM